MTFIISRRDIATPPIRLSITFRFRTVHHVMGCAVLLLILMGCCLNFYEFFKNKKISFHIFSAFYAISNIFRKEIGGGGGLSKIKKISFHILFEFYAISNILE